MESITDGTPLIVILGQTATGKSKLSLMLAQHFGGEIIAADSRTVYRGMDIGTAKPSRAERQLVPHHLIDILSPNERFSVSDFQQQCIATLADIGSRNKPAFLVGGSGLYIDAVVYNFSFRALADPAERTYFEGLSVDELQNLLRTKGISLPTNDRNPRHLIRTLETEGQQPARQPLRPNTLLIGLSLDQEVLEENINARVDEMLAEGFIDEVRRLSEQYGWDAPGLQTPGYHDARMYLDGQISFEDYRQRLVHGHTRFAKRQKTWFKRDPNIHWISKVDEAVDLVTTMLNK